MLIFAFQILQSFDKIDSLEESQIILVSDGQNGHGSLPNATQNCIEEGVVVNSIAVTQIADERMLNISDATGGRAFSYTEDGFLSLERYFLEYTSGVSSPGSSTTATVSLGSVLVQHLLQRNLSSAIY